MAEQVEFFGLWQHRGKALTVLDPACALIVVDLQQDLMGLPGVPIPLPEVVERASELAVDFRRTGRPVVLVNVAGGAPGRTDGDPDPKPKPVPAPEVAAVVDALDPQPSDLRVTKATWGAFTGTCSMPSSGSWASNRS
jgi:nicotinamidase-related amidase